MHVLDVSFEMHYNLVAITSAPGLEELIKLNQYLRGCFYEELDQKRTPEASLVSCTIAKPLSELTTFPISAPTAAKPCKLCKLSSYVTLRHECGMKR